MHNILVLIISASSEGTDVSLRMDAGKCRNQKLDLSLYWLGQHELLSEAFRHLWYNHNPVYWPIYSRVRAKVEMWTLGAQYMCLIICFDFSKSYNSFSFQKIHLFKTNVIMTAETESNKRVGADSWLRCALHTGLWSMWVAPLHYEAIL